MKIKIRNFMAAILTIILLPSLASSCTEPSGSGGNGAAAPKTQSEGSANITELDNAAYLEMLIKYYENGEKLIDDDVRDFLLDYIREEMFKPEVESEKNSPADNERIKRKNELLAEYRTTVDKMCEDRVLKIEEYDEKYKYLMDLFLELLELEPEKTPQETLPREMRDLLSTLKDHLFFAERDGEGSLAGLNINLATLREIVAGLTALKEEYDSGKINYEDCRRQFDEYANQWVDGHYKP